MTFAQRRSGRRTRTDAARSSAAPREARRHALPAGRGAALGASSSQALVLTVCLLGAGALSVTVVLFAAKPDALVEASPERFAHAPAVALEIVPTDTAAPRPRVPAPSARPPDAALGRHPEAGPAPAVALAHARERDLYGEFLGLEQARPGALAEIVADVLAGDGPRAQKIALLRALHDSGAPGALAWFEHAARTLPDISGARGESVPAFALGLLGKAAAREPDAGAALAALAFESPELHVNLRRRAASLHAAHCELSAIDGLMRRLRAEPDASVVAAALAALDGRAEDPTVRRWLFEFETWPRPEHPER